jgi:hypothetical protein
MSTDQVIAASGPASPAQLQALLDPAIARGVFSNLAGIRTTDQEFVLDFLVQFGTELQVVSRVVLTPDHARRLAELLTKTCDAWQKSRSAASRQSGTKGSAKPKRGRAKSA